MEPLFILYSLRKFSMSLWMKPTLSYSLITFILSSFLHAPLALATPLLALREAQNCGGCHKPGRSQRPFFERRCSLDCQGCHVDPTGGGPRNQWGYYYSQDQLSLVNYLEPIDPLQDQSRFDIHVDGRIMQWDQADGERTTFPMALEPGIRLRPFVNYLHLTYQALLLGRIEDNLFRVVNEGDRRFREKYAIMVDALPMNTYIRYYRGTPMYGIKRPNHSLWIRQRIGLDQFATTDALEIGGTPNVPFFRVSQMQGDPYVAAAFRQKGNSFHGGVRGVSFGWHLNGSLWNTASDYHSIKMKAFGAGANIFKTLIYAEKNWRRVSAKTSEIEVLYVHPGSTITEYTLAFAQLKGLTAGLVWEDLKEDTRHNKRRNIFVDVHPIPGIQFEIWHRSETGSRSINDVLGILHVYGDW